MEFDFIQRHFAQIGKSVEVNVGIGDDCALLQSPSTLAVSTDTLVCGTHFLENDDPYLLGWKALAVNLSDLAAVGAKPLWFLLALSIPELNAEWHEKIHLFAKGLNECANTYKIALVGGDTTRGAWSMTLTVLGESQNALLRSGAKEEDDIWLSNEPGWAAVGLDLKMNPHSPAHCLPSHLKERAQNALNRPIPQVNLGLTLRGIAHSAIDVSDGIGGDLAHIANQSQLSAHLFLQNFPQTLKKALPQHPQYVLEKMLLGGEDYHLLFSAPPTQRAHIEALAKQFNASFYRVGVFKKRAEEAIFLWDEEGKRLNPSFPLKGFEHF